MRQVGPLQILVAYTVTVFLNSRVSSTAPPLRVRQRRRGIRRHPLSLALSGAPMSWVSSFEREPMRRGVLQVGRWLVRAGIVRRRPGRSSI